MKINKERLWKHIQKLKTIGLQDDGSITRLPFTKEDKEAEKLLVMWMEEAGLEVSIDAVGNVIGTLEGKDKTFSPVVCGSHFDSVKQGGAFDGCLGVLAGIEVLHTMKEQHIQPVRSLMIIGFKDEEGNRFGYGMVGSKSMSGTFQEEGFSSKDEEGITLWEAMQQSGYRPQDYKKCQKKPYIFIELHIEQAKMLETHNIAIGIVEGIAGLSRFSIEIHGESAHAGATPMQYRNDPVVAMSDWIMQISEYAKKQKHMVATIGEIKTYPGACNVICNQVSFSLDLRALSDSNRREAILYMQLYNKQLKEKYGVTIKMIQEQELPSCPCDTIIQKQLKTICETNKIEYLPLCSGAGHDAMNFKDVCPIGMIFVRSKCGYSHRKDEFSSLQDCALATQILYELLLENAI